MAVIHWITNADLVIEGRPLVELKAAKTIVDEHSAQVLGYRRATKFEHGLLINFGSHRFQLKKFVMNEHGPTTPGIAVDSGS